MKNFKNSSSARKYTILMSVPNRNLQGGPPTHLYLLENALHNLVNLYTFNYSRKTDYENIFHKIFGRMADLIVFCAKLVIRSPDLVHHNTAFDKSSILRDVPLALCASLFGKPLLIKIHGSHQESFETETFVADMLKTTLLKNIKGIAVLSEAEKYQFINKWPFLSGKVAVVKNIIKPEFMSVTRIESDIPSILFISRFIAKKGLFELLDAIPHVLQIYPDTQFYFVGSGSEEGEFDQRVCKMGLSNNIYKISHVSNKDTIKYYSNSWMLVFPTHFPEGMPMVVAEAMAAGLPIISSRTRFSQSYMTEGEHCLFVEPADPADIADKILCLLKDNQLRNEMSIFNRELAKGFSADIVAQEFAALYDQLAMN